MKIEKEVEASFWIVVVSDPETWKFPSVEIEQYYNTSNTIYEATHRYRLTHFTGRAILEETVKIKQDLPKSATWNHSLEVTEQIMDPPSWFCGWGRHPGIEKTRYTLLQTDYFLVTLDRYKNAGFDNDIMKLEVELLKPGPPLAVSSEIKEFLKGLLVGLGIDAKFNDPKTDFFGGDYSIALRAFEARQLAG